jgi:predicted acylesterase/phospholipase RssA
MRGTDTASTTRSDASPYASAVFAGGGCRCFWQLGFWSVAAPALGLAPQRVAGVSAGAAFGAAALLGLTEPILEDFKDRVARNPSNFRRRRERAAGEPAFPHADIYGGILRDHIDQAGLEHLQTEAELLVLLARPHPWLGARRGLALAVFATFLNQWERLVHARWGTRLGFEAELVSSKSCGNPEELIDLIMHSSCVPPIMPYYRRAGRPVLDGGVIDNAPADLLASEGHTLVLLSFPHGETNRVRGPGRTYVQPSGPIPISQWDYTNPYLVQQTYDIGRRDGEAFVARWDEVRDELEGER